MTQKGSGKDEPTWVTCSSSSGSEASDTTAADSGVNLTSPVSTGKGMKKAKLASSTVPAPGSNVSHTPPLSPNTRQELDAETLGGNESQPDDDAPLSGQSNHPVSDANGNSDGEEDMFGVESSPTERTAKTELMGARKTRPWMWSPRRHHPLLLIPPR